MIVAVITYNDGTTERKGMKDFHTLCSWMRDHYGQYEQIDAREIGEGNKNGEVCKDSVL